jgi:hypothetical protein
VSIFTEAMPCVGPLRVAHAILVPENVKPALAFLVALARYVPPLAAGSTTPRQVS